MSARFPDQIRSVLSTISEDGTMNDGVLAMDGRASEFISPMAARLTGIFLNPLARAKLDLALDSYWQMNPQIPRMSSEVIVGGGLHAAIYCAVRVAEGHPKPLVIEANERVGGVFAVSRESSFFLNSRNRPGGLGVPGREESLTFLPGAPVQPADLSGDEYQTNASLAYAIRATLALNAKVLVGKRVMDANSSSVTLDDGSVIKTPRVIYATGLGESTAPLKTNGKHMVDAMEFFAMLDRPFPFQGIKRVAVIGCGDSGKTVVEALIGQGPDSSFSVASLDYIEKIDWYGVPDECRGQKRWRERNRSRYQGIAREIGKRINEENSRLEGGRINPLVRKAADLAIGFDGAYVDGARYDLVVWAGGFKPRDIANTTEYKTRGRVVARMGESGVFIIGPAAQLSSEPEPMNESDSVPENTVALFRYADRTAAFAMDLPALAMPQEQTADPVTIPVSREDDRTGLVTYDNVEVITEVDLSGLSKPVKKERTVKGANGETYKVGDLIARKNPERRSSYNYNYSYQAEQRGKVLAIEGSTKAPKVKIRASNGRSRYTSLIDKPREWQKVERGRKMNGQPTPNY